MNFIVYTTGEIQFFRDFLFAVDRAVDAIAKSNKGSNPRIWKMLEANLLKLILTARADNATACAAITM